MNKEIVSYELGSFVDFKGVERLVVACAYSQPVADGLTASWEIGNSRFRIIRALSVGIAVYNPEDNFSLEQGKAIALERAKKECPSIFTLKGGVINEEVTSAVLKKAIKKFAEHPEDLIANYKEAESKYKEIKESTEFVDTCSEDETAVIDMMANGVDVENIVKKAKAYVEAVKNDSKLVD